MVKKQASSQFGYNIEITSNIHPQGKLIIDGCNAYFSPHMSKLQICTSVSNSFLIKGENKIWPAYSSKPRINET